MGCICPYKRAKTLSCLPRYMNAEIYYGFLITIRSRRPVRPKHHTPSQLPPQSQIFKHSEGSGVFVILRDLMVNDQNVPPLCCGPRKRSVVFSWQKVRRSLEAKRFEVPEQRVIEALSTAARWEQAVFYDLRFQCRPIWKIEMNCARRRSSFRSSIWACLSSRINPRSTGSNITGMVVYLRMWCR